MKKLLFIGVALLTFGLATFSLNAFLEAKDKLDSVIFSEQCVTQGDMLSEEGEAIKLYHSALEILTKDSLIELRILFHRWPEVEERFAEILRAVNWETLEPSVIIKKMDDLKILVENLDKKTLKILSSKTLSADELWRLNNFLGCIKLYKTIFVQDENNEDRKKKIQGLMKEAKDSFKKSIEVIEENKLSGLITDVPRWNLELLIQKQEESKSYTISEDGEGSQDGKIKKIAPILGIKGSQGKPGGLK